MKRNVQIKLLDNDISSKDITDFLKHVAKRDDHKDIVVFSDTGNIIRILTSLSSKVIEKEIEKEFGIQIEVREIKEGR